MTLGTRRAFSLLSGGLDSLLATRLVMDQAGAAKRAYDYLPFGEEIGSGVGGRGGIYGGAEVVAQRFTGKERDQETGLDYFGARYFSGAQGRFGSPDPVNVLSQKIADPQQWNMYAYGRNNPLKYLDPDGKRVIVYTELQKQGHTFLQIQNDRHNVIFSYGRYAGGSSGVNARGLNPRGPGILIRIEGDEGVGRFLAGRKAKDPTLRGQIVNVPDEEAAYKLLQDKFAHGQPLSDEEKAIAAKSGIDPNTAREVDTFNLGWNNCTTLTCDALRAGGSDATWIFSPAMMRNLMETRMPPLFSSYGDRLTEGAQRVCEASGGKNTAACGTAAGR